MRFTRLFDFKPGQLLLFIDTDPEPECYILRIETYCNGIFIRSGIPFSNYGDASEAMDELTQEKAEQMHKALTEIVEPTIPMPESSQLSSRQINGSIEGLEDWINNSTN